MPEFTYVARDASGKRISGSVSVGSHREAIAVLTDRSIFPIEVRSAAPALDKRRLRRVPPAAMAVMYGQLADLLRSGVPLLHALQIVQQQTSHAGLKAILDKVQGRVQDGAPLASAMGEFPAQFGEMAINMVRAGGEGGFLETALMRVAEFTEAQDDLRKRIAGAAAYPAFLAVVGVLVVTVLIVFFVPKFSDLFAQLRERNELPLLTEWLLGLSGWLRSWGLLLLPPLLVGGWYLRRVVQSDAGRWKLDRLRLRLPLAGPIFLGLAVARFCRVLGTLLGNGVPILRGLEIARDATGNRVLAQAIAEATQSISGGQSLAGPLAACKQFPPAVVEMIAVAEHANSLETVLPGIADSLERRTWRRLEIAVRLLEPILLLLLAIVILALVVALLLPVLKMSATI